MTSNQNTVGPYQIISELGIGGMAVVYRANDTRINREIALKILLPQFVDDETFLQRFIREGQNTKRLRHPNIVRTYDAGSIDGHYYIAMELIEGDDLAKYVKGKGELLDFSETIDILSQISGALDYAHSHGFLHRDIKLTNILVCNDGRVLLSDFGAAKQISTDYTMLTATGQSIGTPSYMSPEQARAEINLDFRTDVYSLGVVAFKLFAGRMPFTADNQPELLYKIVYDDVPNPQLYNDEIPLPIANVLRRALSKQPELRYESAGSFVGAIAASKRSRISVAEDLSQSARTTVVDGFKIGNKWRGFSLVMGALACIVILLALSSTVQTQDMPELNVGQMVEDAKSISAVEIDDLGLSDIELPNFDVSGIELSDLGLPITTLEETGFGEDGQINVRDLDFSGDRLTEIWESVPDRKQIQELGRSALNALPGFDKGNASNITDSSQPITGVSQQQADADADAGAVPNAAPDKISKRPPLPSIVPSLPSP